MGYTGQILAVALAAVCGASHAGAGTNIGTLAGNVIDAAGGAIAGAVITAQPGSGSASREAVSDASGRFILPNLFAGDYEVAVTKAGFRPLRKKGVRIDPDRTVQLEFQMDVGPASERLEVSGKTSSVDTGEDIIESLMDVAEMSEMVQNLRDFTDLAYFGPGVARRAAGALGSGFVIGGARADSTNFLVDGFNDHDPRTGGTEVTPNWDAIEEFRVQATGEAAEYGRMAGGVITAQLRTGGNRLHGSAFEFTRSSTLGARNFFDVRKSESLRNQGGVTLNGPVVIPRAYRGEDRTFFLVSWEGLLQSQRYDRLSEVPTPLERAGDFSQSLAATGRPVTIIDPLTGSPFPQNRIPASRIDPTALSLAGFYPLPDRLDPATNYQTDAATRSQYQSVVAKLDEHFGSKDWLSVRYLMRNNSGLSPYTGSDLGIFGTNTASRPTLAGISHTYTFGPSLVNELRLGYTRFAERDTSVHAGQNFNAALGLPGGTDPNQFGFPRFTILNLAALGDPANLPLNLTINTYDAAEALSWTRGDHLLKFGIDALRTQFFQQLANNSRGTFNFLGRWTSDAWSDFLLGLPDSTTRQSRADTAYLFSTDIGIFAQDQFAVTPRLTLSYGLRYEAMRPPYEKYGRLSSFLPQIDRLVLASAEGVPDLASLLAAAGLTGRVTTAADAGLPRSLVYSSNLDFAPRFGFSFRPFAKRNSVVRGGYGIYYANSLLDPIRNDLTNTYPFAISQTFNRVAGQPNALTFQNPFPAALASLPGVNNASGFEVRPGAQYVQSYTLSVDQEFGSSTTLEIDYIGSRGTHLGQRYDLNQPFRSAATPGGLRPFPGFGTINYYSFGANSVYNGGTLVLRRRYRRGLFYGLTYVYSKSIDDASQVSGSSQGDYPGAQNSRNLAAERGRSDWDTGHAFTAFASYTPPWKSKLLRGWALSGDARLYTGQPFTPRVANANLNLGEADRPDRIGTGRLANPTVAEWFNVAAFPTVPMGAYRFGNSGRNILDGPGGVYVNFALSRSIRLSDRVTVQLRGEAINALNHPNFGLPVNYVDAKNAGQILSADAGRNVQFGLRVRF